MSKNWQAIFDRFDTAAQEWGWYNGRMHTQRTLPIASEYVAARLAMLECLASLEKERDEARRERDNPDYTTEDYHRLHRAHCATEDARHKAVEERDVAIVSAERLATAMQLRAKHVLLAYANHRNVEQNDNMDRERNIIRRDTANELATAISALDPKGDQP